MENMDENRRRVICHVTFLRMGEINTLKQNFEANVLVMSRWREPAFDDYALDKTQEPINWEEQWNPKVVIDNTVSEPKVTQSIKLELDEEGEAWVCERKRFKGVYMETLELWEFPFDVQDLSVTVMSQLPVSEVELVEDPDDYHKVFKASFIGEQEWYLYNYTESQRREMAKDPADPTSRHSAVTVTSRAARRPAYFAYNIFPITFLITGLAALTFNVDPLKIQARLQLTFTLLVAAVTFKLVVHNSLPRISYLTYIDRYVMATMVVLGGICFWHGIVNLVPSTDFNKDYIALITFMSLYAIYNFQFFIKIYSVPYRRRRDMTKKETLYMIRAKRQAKFNLSPGGPHENPAITRL